MERFYATQSKPWKLVKEQGLIQEDYYGKPERTFVEGKGELIVSKTEDGKIEREPIIKRIIDLEEFDWITPEELFLELKRDWSHGEDIIVFFDDIPHDVEYKMYDKRGKLTIKTNSPMERRRSHKENNQFYDQWISEFD